jgi:hypothetical protein
MGILRGTLAALVIASCGTSSGGAVDGPAGSDAGHGDAKTADAARAGRVDVAVLSRWADGAPDPSATVMFMDPSGTIVQVETTDAGGNAHAEVPAGSSVTVIQLNETDGLRDFELTTIRGVRPGDHLHARREALYQAVGAATDTMSLTYPAPPSDGVRVWGPCGPGISSLSFASECTTPTFSVLALAVDAVAEPTAAFWQHGIDHIPGGTIDLTGPWQPLEQKPFTVENVPAGTSQVWGAWWPRIGHEIFGSMYNQTFDAPQQPTVALSARVPPGSDYPSIAEAALVHGGGKTDKIILSMTTAPDSLTFDLAANMIPVPTTVVATTTGASWSASAGSADSREVIWHARWTDTIDHRLGWVVIDRSDAPSQMTLPRLPTEFAEDDPASVTPALFSELDATVRYVDQDDVATWDDARQLGAWLAEPIAERFLSGDRRVRITTGSTTSF